MNTDAIVLKGVDKKFDEFSIKDLSLNIKKGYITGLIGPNGSGKTTTIRLIMDFLRTDKGSIEIFGEKLKENEQMIKERIGFVCPENSYYNHLSVKKTAQLVSSFYKSWDDSLFSHYINVFELSEKTKVRDLSTGMKMKLSLSIALSHDADLIILDEPTAGLDPIVRSEVLDILYDIMQSEEKTVLLSTHIITDLEKIADYIVMLNKGQLVFTQSVEALLEQYKMIKGPAELLDPELKKLFIYVRESKTGFYGLTEEHKAFNELFGNKIIVEPASIEEIMVYTVRGDSDESITKKGIHSQ